MGASANADLLAGSAGPTPPSRRRRRNDDNPVSTSCATPVGAVLRAPTPTGAARGRALAPAAVTGIEIPYSTPRAAVISPWTSATRRDRAGRRPAHPLPTRRRCRAGAATCQPAPPRAGPACSAPWHVAARCLTPSEVMRVSGLGATLSRFFGVVGGPAYLRALRRRSGPPRAHPLGQPGNIAEWLASGRCRRGLRRALRRGESPRRSRDHRSRAVSPRPRHCRNS